MPSPSQSTHIRHALLLALLLLTLSLNGLAQNTTVKSTPDPTPAPGTPLPASGGGAEAEPATTSKVKPPVTSDGPIVLPEIKPISIHADRDAEIGHVVGELLEQNHYLQKPISSEISQHWLSNYFLALDPTHLFFLQSDIDEFTSKYGNNLGTLLLHSDNEAVAINPAFEIFNRYLQRVNENVTLAEKFLHDKYDFTKDETFTIRTQKSPWLADAAASETVWRGQIKSDLLFGLLDKKPPEETIRRVGKQYASLLREGSLEDDMDVLEIYLSALTHAYDPHSDYYQPDEAQNFNIAALDHAVTGIGAVLKSVDGYATVEEVIAGGPADLDKRLQAGDKILAIGQGTDEPVDAVNMKLNRVVDMIRGRKGSMVRLVISPATEGTAHKEIILKRDTVSIKDSLAKAHIIEHPLPGGGTEKIGVVDLHDFYKNTAKDCATLVQRLKQEQVAGIILDLRKNGGGLLDQAVDLTGLFVKRQPVVQIRRFDGYIEPLDTGDSHQIYDGPLLVMVNKMSASATEITAAALQDYGRAIVVGDQSTHGKGTVQTLIPLDQSMPIGFPSEPGPGSLKLTIQKFYRVAGGSTQQKGVVPDIVLPSVLDALELGETTLPYYLQYDEVPKIPYDNLNLTAPYLTTLRANSTSRVAVSPDFDYVRHDIAFYKKKVQDHSVSLNLATRLKEQEDLKAIRAARKKDLDARRSTRDTSLDLTLDMVAQNLPAAPPVIKKPKLDPDSDGDSGADADLDNAVNHPKDDPQLDEAVNIMCDYTRLLHDSGSKLVQAVPDPAK